ncbi:hypothetical protein CITRIK5_60003 [Citricoccus sp. K5]|nr:hypothetical protein CITRIK5_60003 [Citricoccus sp. K5]
MDLAHRGRPHPAQTRQATGRRPPAALAETTGPDAAHARTGAGRLSPHPPDPGPSRQSAETLTPRPGTAKGPQKPQESTDPAGRKVTLGVKQQAKANLQVDRTCRPSMLVAGLQLRHHAHHHRLIHPLRPETSKTLQLDNIRSRIVIAFCFHVRSAGIIMGSLAIRSQFSDSDLNDSTWSADEITRTPFIGRSTVPMIGVVTTGSPLARYS